LRPPVGRQTPHPADRRAPTSQRGALRPPRGRDAPHPAGRSRSTLSPARPRGPEPTGDHRGKQAARAPPPARPHRPARRPAGQRVAPCIHLSDAKRHAPQTAGRRRARVAPHDHPADATRHAPRTPWRRRASVALRCHPADATRRPSRGGGRPTDPRETAPRDRPTSFDAPTAVSARRDRGSGAPRRPSARRAPGRADGEQATCSDVRSQSVRNSEHVADSAGRNAPRVWSEAGRRAARVASARPRDGKTGPRKTFALPSRARHDARHRVEPSCRRGDGHASGRRAGGVVGGRVV
jgi:hypothetical protein